MKKHVGKLKNTGAGIAVVFMRLPEDTEHALVVDVDALPDPLQSEINAVVDSSDAQNSQTLHDVLHRKIYFGNKSYLEHLHEMRKLMKVKTSEVIMTPTPDVQMPLDELNKMIEKVATKTENLTDDEILEQKNQYKQRIQEQEEISVASKIKNLLYEAEEYEAQSKILQRLAKNKREEAEKMTPEPKQKLSAPRGRPKKKDA